MSRWIRRRRAASNERGAILVFALIIVTAIALVVGTLLTRGDGSLRATVALRQVAGSSYAADAAAQIALNDLRTGYWDGNATEPSNWAFTNVVGDGCFGKTVDDTIVKPDADLTLSNYYPASLSSGGGPTSAYIDCQPEDATGSQGTVPHVNPNNSIGDAVIMLGTSSSEDGIYNQNKPLTVRGGVWVASNINAKKAIQVNNANVRMGATGSCTNITVSTGYSCRTSVTGPTLASVDYAPDITTIPSLQTVPACNATSATYVALTPGYYDDVTALEALNSCNKTLWFKPGDYYFDFHNNSSTTGSSLNDPLYQASIATGSTSLGDQWDLTNSTVIGGTPVDGAGNPLAVPPAAPSLGTACQSPITSAAQNGVQFILGGDSSIDFAGGTELCASYQKNRPPIVVYELQDKYGSNPALSQLAGTAALIPSGTATVTGTGTDPATFTPLDAGTLQTANAMSSTWTRTTGGTNGNESRTIKMGGFAPPTAIARGAVVTSAKLLVTHKETSTKSGISVTAKAADGSSLAPVNVTMSNARTTLTTDTVDVTSNLAKLIHDNGFSGASIGYTATIGRNSVAQLDAMRLEISYYLPQMRGPSSIASNCVTTVGGCYIIDTDKRAQAYLQGTTYVPLGAIDLQVANTVGQVFRWGVVGRSLNSNLNGASPPGALIELPDNSPGFGIDNTLVQLKIYVCPGQGTCSASGTLALKVRAQIVDADGDASTINDRSINVLSWSEQR